MNFSAGTYSTINANRAKERRYRIHRSMRYLHLSHWLLFLVNDMHKASQVSSGEVVLSQRFQSRHILYEHNRARNIRTRVTGKVSSKALRISFRIPCFDYNSLVRFRAIYTGICRVIIIS